MLNPNFFFFKKKAEYWIHVKIRFYNPTSRYNNKFFFYNFLFIFNLFEIIKIYLVCLKVLST